MRKLSAVGPVQFRVERQQLAKGTQHSLWVLNLPDGSAVIVREESHPLGVSPCAHQPPPGVDTWHYNIEYQKPTGYRDNKRAVFNLHMAVWRSGDTTCFSSWNINPSRCIYSNCVGGDQLDQVKDSIREVAQSVVDAFQSAAEMTWTVAMAIAAAIIWIITRPFTETV